MKGVSLDIWELIGIAGGTYRDALYLALAGIPRLGEESRLKRIRKALTREEQIECGVQWRLDGKLHREDDLPAAIYSEETQVWHKNGKRHRILGPAVILPNGYQEWWENGKYINK